MLKNPRESSAQPEGQGGREGLENTICGHFAERCEEIDANGNAISLGSPKGGLQGTLPKTPGKF